ncbi:MAG: choice-of-anchor tandem repeat GloVer-containing protein [Bacteroidia bacterium]
MMYGTTYEGGGSGKYGTIFQCDTLGNERVIYSFYTANDSDSYYLYGNVIQAPNGTLYGMVPYGGTGYYGIVYKCDTLGNLKVLYSFGGHSNYGKYPYGSPVFGNGDTLYGLVYEGGTKGYGAIFKCDTNDGSGAKLLYNFTGGYLDGEYPYGTPTLGSDGNLYGLTYEGGVTGEGTIFKYNMSTATENIVYNFGTNVLGSDGLEDFIQGKDGNLYGMANSGGAYGSGTLLKYNPVTGKTTVLHAFYDTANNGSYPKYGRLIQGSNGTLYGVAEYGGSNNLGVVFEYTISGMFNVLYSFGTNANDGSYPVGGLVMEQNGLYGMTSIGGTNNNGIIFKCDTLGNETILYNFGTNSNDGSDATGSLIQSLHGTLYGMTNKGGANGDGIIFKCDTLGNETVLYSFGTNSNDGLTPYGSLVFGRDSMLYGTTSSGGAIGNGTVFKSDTLGNETVLYNFGTNSNDGSDPVGSLIIGSDSNIYGTTEEGGLNGYGTLFKCDTLGNEAVLYSFAGNSDGAYPEMDLLEVMSIGASLSATSCSGTIVNSSVRGSVAPLTYSWSNGSTSSADTMKTAGTYTLMVTDARGITVTTTVTTTYNVVNVTASNTSVCNGSSASLSANGTGGTGSLTYSWMPGSLSGSSPSVSPASTITYTATVTDGNGCMDSAMETVTVDSLPVVTITGKDTINQGSNDTLTATGGTTYMWSDGSSGNPDIVSPSFTETFTVSVTNSNGCTSTDTIRVVVNITTGMHSVLASNSTAAYPNPATSMLNLAFNTSSTTDGMIEVCDVTGNVIITKEQTISNGETMQIDVSNLASGLYFVKVTTGKQIQVMRFIKQ